MNGFLLQAMLGMLLLLCSLTTARADASAYFPALTTNEKEEYTKWVNDHSSSYPRHTFMPSAADQDEGAAIFWNIDGDKVYFATAVRAEGWVGFGISEAGGMRGADMVLYEAAKSELIDAYVVEDRAMPLTDDCQDWTLEGAIIENGWMIVEMSRLLDTKDGQDHAIKEDANLWAPPTRFIAAWGDDDSVKYHGQKKARGSVRLFASYSNDLTEKEAILETLERDSDGYIDVAEKDLALPASTTHYHELCKAHDELKLPEGQGVLTLIGATPIITDETAQFVHHFLVYIQNDCDLESPETQASRNMIFLWAPGDEGLALPNDVGFPIQTGGGAVALYL